MTSYQGKSELETRKYEALASKLSHYVVIFYLRIAGKDGPFAGIRTNGVEEMSKL